MGATKAFVWCLHDSGASKMLLALEQILTFYTDSFHEECELRHGGFS